MPVLNIVLVEPQIPANTGTIARPCPVTGARLHLSRPLGLAVPGQHPTRQGLDDWLMLDFTFYDNPDGFFRKH